MVIALTKRALLDEAVSKAAGSSLIGEWGSTQVVGAGARRFPVTDPCATGGDGGKRALPLCGVVGRLVGQSGGGGLDGRS